MLAALRKGYGVGGGATDLVSGLGLQFLKNLLRLGLRCQSHDEDLERKSANGERRGRNVSGDVHWGCSLGMSIGRLFWRPCSLCRVRYFSQQIWLAFCLFREPELSRLKGVQRRGSSTANDSSKIQYLLLRCPASKVRQPYEMLPKRLAWLEHTTVKPVVGYLP